MKYTSKKIEEILTSPAAKRGLDYITPIYQEAKNALWLMQAMGLQTDLIIKWVEEYKDQLLPQTATWMLSYFEEEYGIISNPAISPEERQRNLLLSIRTRAPMNPAKLENLLAIAANIERVRIEENTGKNAFSVIMENTLDKSQMQKFKNVLNNNKPAHLIYLIITLIEAIFKNSNAIKFHRLLINAHIKNLGLEYYFLNGQKLLDGSWVLQSCTRTLRLNSFMLKTYIRNLDVYPVSLNGKCLLDGSWKLDSKGKNYYANLKILFGKRNRVNSLQEGHFLFSTGIINLSLDYATLNGRRRLDGGWHLNSFIKGIQLERLIITARQREIPIQLEAKARYLACQKNAAGSMVANLGYICFSKNMLLDALLMHIMAKSKNIIRVKGANTFLLKGIRLSPEQKVKLIYQSNGINVVHSGASSRFAMAAGNKNQIDTSKGIIAFLLGGRCAIQSWAYVLLQSFIQNARKDKLELVVKTKIKEKQAASSNAACLTLDTMWRMGGTEVLDGSRKLNADIVKVNL